MSRRILGSKLFHHPVIGASLAASANALRWPSTLPGSGRSRKPMGLYCFFESIFCGMLIPFSFGILFIRELT
jgi:hypothetical protein